MKTKIEQKTQYRSAQFDVQAREDGSEYVRMSVSSEQPVLTYVFLDGEYRQAYEILDHSPESIDLSRCSDGMVILDNHGGDQIGLMRIDLRDGKLGGEVEFCSGARAQEIKQDAIKGLRRNTSVGYRVDPRKYKKEGERDGIPVVRAMRWMPYESSFVAVPADSSVGVGRSNEKAENKKQQEEPATENKKRSYKMEPKEMAELFTRASKHGIDADQVQGLIDQGQGRAELDALIVERQAEEMDKLRKEAEKPVVQVKPESKERTKDDIQTSGQILDNKEREEVAKRFSIVNVIRHMAANAVGEKSNVDIGFEREVSREFEKRTGKSARGIFVPHDVCVRAANPFLKTGNGSAFVQTDLLSGSLIDALRSKMVLADAGVTMLTGLVGDVAIPKGNTIAGGWIDGELGTVTDQKPNVSQVTGTPKTAAGECVISRRLYLQSSIDIENFVQNELMNTVARLIETAAFAGTNANGQPKGLINQAGVNTPSVTTDAPTRKELIEFLTAIMANNADFPNKSWITRPEVAGLLRSLPDGILRTEADDDNVSTFGMGVLLKDDNRMIGNPVYETTNVPAHHLFFGAWSQMIIGMWSGLDLLVDPYSNSSSGALKVVAHQDVDVMVRNGEAFSYAPDVTA